MKTFHYIILFLVLILILAFFGVQDIQKTRQEMGQKCAELGYQNKYLFDDNSRDKGYCFNKLGKAIPILKLRENGNWNIYPVGYEK